MYRLILFVTGTVSAAGKPLMEFWAVGLYDDGTHDVCAA